MFWRFCLILFIGVLLEWKLTHSAPAEVGKKKEKVRAYEFGFSIEEQQHRHEKRDENGIVMGEFGFITADGIYHVTVYATDENGKFKIISMKNYPYGNPEKKIMIAMLPPPKKQVVAPSTMIKALVPDGSSCGGCIKPKKLDLLPADVKGKKTDVEKPAFEPLSKDLNDKPANGKTIGGATKGSKSTPTMQSKSSSKPTGSLLPTGGVNGNGKTVSQQPPSKVPGLQPLIPPKVSTPGAQKLNAAGATSSKNGPGSNGDNKPSIDVRFDSEPLTPSKTNTPSAQKPNAIGTEKGSQKGAGNNEAKTPTTNTQSTNNQTPGAPSSQSTGKTTSSKNTAAGGIGGGGGPLYRFNYVLDYNSHREEGRADGSKEGNYNTIDEDGIRRIIDYIANENGYQPHIKLERLPPNELPTGENKLKEYEFVWFN